MPGQPPSTVSGVAPGLCLKCEFGVPSHKYAHFKAGYSEHGRAIMTNNSYDERDWSGAVEKG